MSKDIIWYAENICGVNLTETQKNILNAVTELKDGGKRIFLHYGRARGIGLMKRIFDGFEIWLKDQKIAELEKALELACDKIDAEYMDGIYCNEYSEYFKTKAKEMLKDE